MPRPLYLVIIKGDGNLKLEPPVCNLISLATDMGAGLITEGSVSKAEFAISVGLLVRWLCCSKETWKSVPDPLPNR